MNFLKRALYWRQPAWQPFVVFPRDWTPDLQPSIHVTDYASYAAQVERAFRELQDWFAAQLDGRTFRLLPVSWMVSTLSIEEWRAKGSFYASINTFREARAAGIIGSLCNERRFYYGFLVPYLYGGGAWGRDQFRDANNEPECDFTLPGMAWACGWVPRDDLTDPKETQGSLAHEAGHCFGLAHSVGPSVMSGAMWDYPACGFLPEEKAALLSAWPEWFR